MDEIKASAYLSGKYKNIADEMRTELLKSLIKGSSKENQSEWLKNQRLKESQLIKRLDLIAEKSGKEIKEETDKIYKSMKLEPPSISANLSEMKSAVLDTNSLIISLVATAKVKNSLTKTIAGIYENKPVAVKTSTGNLNFDSYLDASIEHDIKVKGIEKLKESGIKLFKCNSYSDPAPDHAAYQGKIYVLEKYKDEYPEYATVEYIVSAPVRLTTRWNCRHKLVPIKDPANPPKEDVISRKEADRNYKLFQKQRQLERYIREKNKKMKLLKTVYNETQDPADMVGYKAVLTQQKEASAKLKSLVEQEEFLERDYKREQPDFNSKDLTAGEIKTSE